MKTLDYVGNFMLLVIAAMNFRNGYRKVAIACALIAIASLAWGGDCVLQPGSTCHVVEQCTEAEGCPAGESCLIVRDCYRHAGDATTTCNDSACRPGHPCGTYTGVCSEAEICTCPDGNTNCSTTISCAPDAHGVEFCQHTPCSPDTPPALHRMSPEYKASLGTVNDALKATLAFGGITGAFMSIGDPAAAAFFAVSFAAISASTYAIDEAINHDPPDKDYEVVFVPHPQKVVGMSIIARLKRNEFALRAYGKALLISVDRVNSADAAGDVVCVDKQQGAIDRYLFTIGKILINEAYLRKLARPRFKRVKAAAFFTDPALLGQMIATGKLLTGVK